MAPKWLLLIVSCAALAGCATPPGQYTATGAALGGLTGAVLGHQIDGDNGRYAGGAAGAMIGAAIGNNADALYEGRAQAPEYSRYDETRYGYDRPTYRDDPHYRDDRYYRDSYRTDPYYDQRGYAPYPPNRTYR